MDDNLIRIPSRDYLDTSIKSMVEDFECSQHADTCVTAPTSKQHFTSTYETVTQNMDGMMNFPVLGTRVWLTPVGEPATLENPREIGRAGAEELFVDVMFSAATLGPDDLPQAMPRLHDAVYWARRSGMPEEEIQYRLDTIRELYLGWFTRVQYKERVKGRTLPPLIIPGITPEPELSSSLDPVVAKDSPLDLMLGVQTNFYPNKFMALEGLLSSGLKYYVGADRKYFFQSGISLGLAQSLNNNPENNLSASPAPYFFVGGGIKLPKNLELRMNTQWGLIDQTHVVYHGDDPEPVTTQSTKLLFDGALELAYKGFGVDLGYHLDRGMYVGVGYAHDFNLRMGKK